MKLNNSFLHRTSKRILLFGVAFLFLSTGTLAQETVVVGQVLDKYDKSPISTVDIYFKNSNRAVQSNDDGYFLIRNNGPETTLIFTIVGYKPYELKLKRGDNVGVQIELEEKKSILDEVLVLPGINPANDLMRKVRLMRKQNDVKLPGGSVEQSAVFLTKNDTRWQNNKLWENLKTGNLSQSDSALMVPLYMDESEYNYKGETKQQKSKNTYNTPETAENLIVQLLNGLDNPINFYDNSVSLLNKSLISPLANIGNAYYRYYLTDSIQSENGKQYEVHFYSRNPANLAFNGTMHIDSTTLSLTYMAATLPRQANLNFIHNLTIEQKFRFAANHWIPDNQQSTWYMTYDLLKDNLNTKPELLVNRKTVYASGNDEFVLQPDSFAGNKYSEEAINDRLAALQQTPLYKTARFIADAALTGYLKAGKIDIGKISTILRLTDVEGLRIGLPFRTNEGLWKNLMIGGYGAYGFGDKKWKYGAEMQWKIPTTSSFMLGVKYINDYRRTDYDYTDFIWRENPLITGDHDIVSTLFSLKKGNSLQKVEEFSAFASRDITSGIEATLMVQNKKTYSSAAFPFTGEGQQMEYETLHQQSASLTGRFSFNERYLDEHFQRIYLKNNHPVIYGTVEMGNYKFGTNKGNYMRFIASIQQTGRFPVGEWRYLIEAGKITGNVPYPILKNIRGKSGSAYGRYQFTLMNFNEYMADTYATLQSEVITNGIIFNNIPLVKKLNLREITGLKIAGGSLSELHTLLMNLPPSTSGLIKPYSEVSVGFTNLFGAISVQYTRRLTDTDKPATRKSSIGLSLMFSF